MPVPCTYDEVVELKDTCSRALLEYKKAKAELFIDLLTNVKGMNVARAWQEVALDPVVQELELAWHLLDNRVSTLSLLHVLLTEDDKSCP